MNIRMLKPEEWDGKRFPLLRFIRRHGDKRIPTSVWLRLVRLQAGELGGPGAAMAVAFTSGGQPVGVAYAADEGEKTCLVVVHPALRGRGVSAGLLAELGGRRGLPEAGPEGRAGREPKAGEAADALPPLPPGGTAAASPSERDACAGRTAEAGIGFGSGSGAGIGSGSGAVAESGPAPDRRLPPDADAAVPVAILARR